MHLKNQRLIFIVITIISSIFIFIFYSFINYDSFISLTSLISRNQNNKTSLADELVEKQQSDDYGPEIDYNESLILETSLLAQSKYVVRLNNQWIVNKNIIQYSIYVVIKPNNTFSIESFVFTKDHVVDFKCNFLIPDKNISKIIPSTRKIEIISPMVKVFCESNEVEIDDNTIVHAAIVNQNGSNETIYQRAVIIDSRVPKI